MVAIDVRRQWQYNQLQNNIRSIQSIIDMNNPDALTTYRDTGTGWTVLEVICHLRDYETLFTERVQAMIKEDNPNLVNPNPDELAIENEYMAQNVQDVMDTWHDSRLALIDLFMSLDDEQWQRTGVHPRRGEYTSSDQLALTTLHDTVHIEQITRILNEKR